MWSPVPSKWEPLCRVCCLSAHCHCIILVYVSGFLSLLADFHLIEVGSPVNNIWCSCELEWKNKKRREKKEKHMGFYDEEDIYFIPLEQSSALTDSWCRATHCHHVEDGAPQFPLCHRKGRKQGLKEGCSQQGRDITTDPVTKHEISAVTQS